MPSAAAELTPRRRRLVEAAVAVVAESGLRGLTHRAVDARAGLPEGSCSTYLRTRLALLTALVEHVAGNLAADVEALSERLIGAGGPDASAGETAALFTRWLARPDMVRVRAELMLEAMRQPELMAVYRPWRDDLVGVVERVVEAHGHADARHRSETVVAALEGVLTAGLLQPARARDAHVRSAVDLVVRALAAYPPGR